jgi:hypothetical protein
MQRQMSISQPPARALLCQNGRFVTFSAKWRDEIQPVSRFPAGRRPAVKVPPPIIPGETTRLRAGQQAPPTRTCWRQVRIFSHSRALRVAVMAWSMHLFGPAPDLAAGTLFSPSSADLMRKSAEPFGAFAFRLPGGGLREKRLGVQRELDDEQVQLALCNGDRERCVSPAALRFLAIVDNADREGRARLGEINLAINLAIRPMSELPQYGEIDVWSSPLIMFANGTGDCEATRSQNSSLCARPASRGRGPMDRDHARKFVARIKSLLRRGWTATGARWTTAACDGRGRVCPQLPAAVCHRSIRRHAVCRRTPARGRAGPGAVRSAQIGC